MKSILVAARRHAEFWMQALSCDGVSSALPELHRDTLHAVLEDVLSEQPDAQIAVEEAWNRWVEAFPEVLMMRIRRLEQEMQSTERELMTTKETARLCRSGVSTWLRNSSAEKTPEPVRVGGRVYWLRSEIMAWLKAGAPCRSRWETMKMQKKAG